MFDMAAVALGNPTSNINSNSTVNASCSPSLKMSHHTSHIQFHSSPSNNLIRSSPSNSLISSPGSHSSTTNTTPNNHHIIPSIPHNNNLHIKKEPGLISPASGSENDQPLSNNSNPSSCGSESINAKCKRKINFSHLGIPQRGHQPATVARRNARERNRVKQVNNGFASLKQHIPLGHRAKKMSKVETLRCAVDYIRNLKSLLDPGSILLNPNNENHGDVLISDSSSPTPYSSHHHPIFDFDGSAGSLSHTTSTTQQLSPTSSEDPSSPSYNSEGSYANASTNSHGQNPNTNMYDYENYEPVSPEDDELLDAISWWQQS